MRPQVEQARGRRSISCGWTASRQVLSWGGHAQPGDRQRPQIPGVQSKRGPTEEPSDSDIDRKGTNH